MPSSGWSAGLAVWLFGFAPFLCAHPMGNFSVNHYARFDLHSQNIELTYVLDLAEIPTFELLSGWNVDARDQTELTKRAAMEAQVWLAHLKLRSGGKPAVPAVESVSAQSQDGAGGLPVFRVAITARLAAEPGEIEYEDRNYTSPPGWKEIVVVPHTGIRLIGSKDRAVDRSHALTAYPADAIAAPPQETKARFRWSGGASPAGPPRLAAVRAAPPAQPLSRSPRPEPAGTVVRGDYLSRMLGGRQITFAMALAGLCVAFALGALHALSPGHGKTIVAAYLVGSRGTMKHALLLGATVTATHTSTVFALGLGVLFFEQYIVPEKIIPVLGAVSGLSIVAIGAVLLYRRAKALRTSTTTRMRTLTRTRTASTGTTTHPTGPSRSPG